MTLLASVEASPELPIEALSQPGGAQEADLSVELPRLRAIARHAVPNLVECTLVPTVIFSVALHFWGLIPASLAALGWAYTMLGRRLLIKSRVPGLLLLTCLGLTVRTAVVVASGSAFIYFLQPIAATTAVGLTFFASSFTNNPMVDRLAKDFCPLTSDIVARRRVRQLFRRLTVMWAAVNLLNAGITGWLLMTQSVAVFVAVKPIAAMVVTWSAVAITVLWSLRIASKEGLRTRRAGRGEKPHLHVPTGLLTAPGRPVMAGLPG